MDESAIKTIQQTAIDAAMDRIPDGLSEHLIALPKDYNLHDLERFLPNRLRFRGQFTTNSVADFTQYVKDNVGGQGFIRADSDGLESTVFFNLGDPEVPGHADWTAKLAMERTPAFDALLDFCNQPQTQREVIDFIEDWSHLLSAWKQGDGEDSEPISLTKAVAAIRKVKIKAQSESETQHHQFKNTQSRLDSVEASSDEGLPDLLTFTTEPYHGLPKREFDLRLSILTGGQVPALCLRIVAIERHTEEIGVQFKELLLSEIGDSAQMLIGGFRA